MHKWFSGPVRLENPFAVEPFTRGRLCDTVGERFQERGGSVTDQLDVSGVAVCLRKPRGCWRVLDEVDSTNTECRRLAADGAGDGLVIMADRQTAGRGRRGRSFDSPQGLGLYLSILWRPDCPPEALLPLTALSAVAACRAVERASGAKAAIKWPNDLVLNGHKLGGILTELTLDGKTGRVDFVIVGIGINCHQRRSDFGPELADLAISLDMADRPTSRANLAAALMEELDTLRAEVLGDPGRWLDEYRRRCLTLGRRVQILRDGERLEADAVDVDEQYGLTVRLDDGTKEILRAGEVSVRGLYGYV